MTTASTFVVPDRLHPRDRYVTSSRKAKDGEGLGGLDVTVDEADRAGRWVRTVGGYVRNYPVMYDTFEPFRQYRNGAWRDYALISCEYTHAAVMDLADGTIIAVEQPGALEVEQAQQLIASNPDRYGHMEPADLARTWGFCPTQFFVPDWWDTQDGSMTPDSAQWGPSDEAVTGEFGFVAGCQWGDDDSWKLRFVDLSRINEGVLVVDERFGYVELPSEVKLADAVSYDPEIGTDAVHLCVRVPFTLSTGNADSWTRDAINWGPEQSR